MLLSQNPARSPALTGRWNERQRQRRVCLNRSTGGVPLRTGGDCSPGCHQCRCKAVPEAELRKALPALLMAPLQGAVCSRQRDASCEQEESSESCPIPGAVNECQHLKGGLAAGVPHLPGAQEPTWHKQGNVTCERAVSAAVENGFCTRDGSVREPGSPQGTSAANKEHKRNLRRFLGEWFRSHPVVTVVLILLLGLVLALGVALAVQSAPQIPVPPATPLSLMGCPHGWVGYKGVCYYFSRDYGTWEQAQERCSQLNASLAIARDEEAMDLLFRLRGNGDFWLGLRRRGERLQWEDGSSYSSRVPVLGNSQCVYLADGNKFRSEFCSNERPYVCSKAQGPL
ncbi:C-type lectin domain family 2 member D2-like isoform X2 [Haemorhous mexicanus]|uniref:C-type lectin domain family 2 member D2-like isoform X2 n=1 Tax=Haemorhous mexicanus TaxID=30427 RepID=UPI0028BDD305|nr:C-type lectin domain family 2 member D2-like isoform X2 [Haemorhous mexicanus]